ncbi:MAG: glycosyl transferase [Candidatus Omnitrophica bacterium CG11_big_fil_rev_8_21_14_0_20_42_13]|uniref:Glycosyl transferase n=1 Tax=Candidatus Ghiorseimicrobium undicola TaxID=1974746 RepID=A0A2H0M1T5_9BACT|nr:MAG: glycosyl transferase [Candidatus Omnitrophica bacterium CG11_big_fil_rev_8_21_14_0_20_42_13]
MSKRKLHIAHVHWGFPPIIGGVETHLTILLPSLIKMGNKVSLLTGSFEGAKAEDTYEGVKVFRQPIMDLNWLGKRGINGGLAEEVNGVFKKFIDKNKPDCIHVHNMHYFSKIHAAALQKFSKKLGIPLILTAHNVWDDNLFLDLTNEIRWTHIIAVSHFIKREIIGTGYNHHNITVIHHGIDQDAYSPNCSPKVAFKKYPILKGKRVVFHPARMGLAKGCDVSIKALRIIKQRFPDVVLALAGTKNIIDWTHSHQKDIAYMVSLVKFLKLEKNVLIDTYKLSDMPTLYAASSVCVYPSTASEPFGLTMLEALASARPMVVTEAGGMPEIIRDGINGFVVPVKDFEALASRVIQLLANNQLRERLGYTGRQIVEQQYTKEIITENTLNLYRKFV